MPTQTFFLEEWLRSNSSSSKANRKPSPSSARAIIQAWSDLRDSLQQQSFQPHHFQSLQTLLNSQTSLHIADPQAKILLSILSSLSPPSQSHPLFLKLLYIWLRKSSKPSPSLLELSLSILSTLFATQFDGEKPSSSFIPSQGVLVLGAISSVPLLPQTSRHACLDLLCKLLEQERRAIGLCEELIPEVLSGIGYALSYSPVTYFGKILASMFRIWSKDDGIRGDVIHGLMILHLIEWVVSGFISFRSFQKIDYICREIWESRKLGCSPFAEVMAAAGALRALNKTIFGSGVRAEIGPKIRNSLEDCIESVARDLIMKIGFGNSSNDLNDRLVLQCVSLSLSRCGLISYRAPFISCLVSTLLFESFPLMNFYKRVVEFTHVNLSGLSFGEVEEHLSSIVFKEAGVITRAFCDQYVSADEENKCAVENLIWSYCHDLYSGHRWVALVLQDGENELLGHLEKIAEACFFMVVVFASVVTKHRLNPNFSRDIQLELSVKILVSFSCVEYFRRSRLPEYTDTIRGVVLSVQENDTSCLSFVESMPCYAELTNYPSSSCLEKMNYVWSKDYVQTARILFYLRVIPTCIERVPCSIFRNVVAPTMFLYLGHPNGKVARASHSVFVAFISSGKDSNQDDKVLLKEQLVFYYIQRALEGYPGVTPFEGMASGVASLVRHLPAGSPAIFYCIHSLAEKASSLCSKATTLDADMWKNWEGDSESTKKMVELLLRLISLVDIQVLPNLMKLLAQLIVQLPKGGQNLVLDELHSLVAESDDVTRKPALVSWLQSLSFLCSQSSISNIEGSNPEGSDASTLSRDSLNRISARL